MREDLYALTPEAVAALANVGLVKRALRELEAGQGPSLTEESDGTVIGTFPDGVVARLVPGRPLRDVPCSCPAMGVCRHRVATALAYRAFASSASGAHEGAREPDFEPWSPGELDDAALATLGRRPLEEARAARRRGVVAVVRRPRPSEPATVELPSCTVRFLVPRELAYARCDCRVGIGCAHVALAVWAFREADTRDREALEQTVEVRDARAEAVDESPLEVAVSLARHLVVDGVANAREALGQRFALARSELGARGWLWPESALEALEASLARYRSRSARYTPEDVLDLVVELEARRRAVARSAGVALPAAHVLGKGERHETALDHLRLVGLGARGVSEGTTRGVEVLLADPDTGAVLVHTKSWDFAADAEVPSISELGRRRAAGTSLAQLAAGQVVTRAAKRRANRAVLFGNARGATSVTPQVGDWDRLPAPLRAESVAALLRERETRPPHALRPRVLADDVYVLPIAGVDDVRWDPATQRLVAVARDLEDTLVLVVREHRAHAPDAEDVLAAALSGRFGAPRYLAGEVHVRGGAVFFDPTAVVAGEVIVPELRAWEPRDGERAPIARGALPPDAGDELERARGLLAEGVQLGLRDLSGAARARLGELSRALERGGLSRTANVLERAGAALEHARVVSDEASWDDAAAAWIDAGLRVELALEAR
ncbi:MAG: hypothetical protein KF901_18480 [Myxococcales bacterium]|nr:hypothetical protein [Myxococcales bacterium]